MGLKLMPHQAQVVDAALELGDDGQFAYRTVVFTVPRQGGKTELLRAVTTWWGLARRRNLIVSTAQSGVDARTRWLESMEDLEGRPWFARQMRSRPRRANGTERLVWRTGTRHRPAPPTPRRGHGDVIDLAVVDEAWAFADETVLVAIRPAMMTRDAQLWLVSTAGTEASLMLRRHVELGRRAVANGDRAGVAYFEWSAPDDADVDDEEAWWAAIPTLGRTVSVDRIRADRQTMNAEDFRRSYLNQWVEAAEETVFPWGVWLLVCETNVQVNEPFWLSADINPERTWGSIAVAGSNDDGTRVVCKLLEVRAGTEWIAPRLEELRSTYDVAGIVLDQAGPAATLEPDLTEPPVMLNTRELQIASQAFYDTVLNLGVTIERDQWLTSAMRGAFRLGGGDGAWRWGRKRSRNDVSPLVAVTLAWWKARAELGAPSLRIW